ncbi:putative transposase [Vibrio cholerae HCUF01]|nr:putative transposase [Vibrio cholerae HCUF01]
MAIKNEITILTRAEQADLYSPPIFSIEEQRLYFSLNDAELAVFRSIRLRAHRCYFVAILGYFKSKPVILDIAYSQVSKDLMFISKELLGGKGLRPFTPSQKQKDRLYAKVLDLAGYHKWTKVSTSILFSTTLFRWAMPGWSRVTSLILLLNS